MSPEDPGRPPRSFRPLVCALLVGAAMAALAPAAGAQVTHADGRFLGIAPLAGPVAPSARSAAQRPPHRVAARHAALPIGQPRQHFTSSYQNLINRYFGDVALDSGSTTNVYGVSADYGASPIFGHSGIYQSTFGGAFLNTDPYPADQAHSNASGCTAAESPPTPPDAAWTWCLTDGQIRTELANFIARNHLPQGMDAIYFVMLPAGIDVCTDSGSSVCADNFFCAYHSALGSPDNPQPPLYAVDPYGARSGCGAGQQPNGDPADQTLTAVSHEHNETITDPLGNGWYDTAGNEIGDKCVLKTTGPIFGSPLGGSFATDTAYNQLIGAQGNRHPYLLQDEFSNANQGSCVQYPGAPSDNPPSTPPVHNALLGYHGGPVVGAHDTYAIYWDPPVDAVPPSASFSGPVASNSGQNVTFDASASQLGSPGTTLTYSWDFGDGGTDSSTSPTVVHDYTVPGPHTVSLLVTDSLGYADNTQQKITIDASPIASFTIPAGAFNTGQAVPFDASASTDPDGTVVAYQWDFGDGVTGAGVKATHAYGLPGTYLARLTVTDNSGNQSWINTYVMVQSASQGTTTGPNGFGAGVGGPATRVSIARFRSMQVLALDNGVLVLTGEDASCPIGGPACKVAVSVTARDPGTVDRHTHRRSGARTVTIGTASVDVLAGNRVPVAVHLSRQGIALLARVRHLHADFRVVVSVGGKAALRSSTALSIGMPSGLGRSRSHARGH